MSKFRISASSFYNLSKCHRRVYLDLYGNPDERGEYSDFVQMLWERGVRIEGEIVEKIQNQRALVAVNGVASEELFLKTVQLMKEGAPLVYQGVLINGDHVGRPDLLEKIDGRSKFGNWEYVPCDIKSGRATADRDGGDIKQHYANQILFYCDLLEAIQGSKPRIGKIIDIAGEETIFDIAEYDADYRESKLILNEIVYKKKEPEPIVGGICKECVWSDPCFKIATERQDPTLLFKLGKQKYQLRSNGICNINDVSNINIAEFSVPPTKMHRVGPATLEQWKRRANVWKTRTPIIHKKPDFRLAKKEVFYDIEDDPSIDHVYLHGFIEVVNGKRSDYQHFFVLERENEEKAARQFWEYIDSLAEDDVIYHYGSYEKTKANRLKEKYNLSSATLEKFDRLRVDLYRIVEQCSDWPLSSYGVKSIAKHLGFKWTAEDASGANSIAWFQEYQSNPTKNDLLEKILTYNREDCEAMIVVKGFIATGSGV
jgi:predicted RecB family nuclease